MGKQGIRTHLRVVKNTVGTILVRFAERFRPARGAAEPEQGEGSGNEARREQGRPGSLPDDVARAEYEGMTVGSGHDGVNASP